MEMRTHLRKLCNPFCKFFCDDPRFQRAKTDSFNSINLMDCPDQFCRYCIIPYARGRVRSRSMEDVLDEVRTLADNGYKEVVLTGIHLSSYGIDFDKEYHLLELIRAVYKII